MAKFSTVPEVQAPKRIAPRSGVAAARMRMYDDFVAGLKKKEVGEVTPEAGETAHALGIRLSRAARRQNLTAKTWLVDGKAYVRIDR